MSEKKEQGADTSRPSKYPRAAAVRVLARVLSDHETLDEAMTRTIAEMNVPASQRAWLQEICAGTLRWKGRLDLAIDSVVLKKKPTGWLRKLLLLAAYQLIAQDRVQAASVVTETVDEIKNKEGEAPAKFANACLRKISEHAETYRHLEAAQGKKPADWALWASLPEWLWTKVATKPGFIWAKGFSQACLDRPVTWVRLAPGSTPPAASEAGEWIHPEGAPAGAYQLTGGGLVTERSGFVEGRFFVQDVSSQVLIERVSEKVRAALGDGPLSVLDLCAAPGGKTAGMAWNGFRVVSTDRGESAPARLQLLRETVERISLSLPEGQRPRVIDRAAVVSLEPQDVVWVDAPCSGSGIIRRHPDVRWLRQENELVGLTRLQLELIQEAWTKVRPGGFLVYSVCSILPEEGPAIVEKAELSSFQQDEWLLAPHLPPGGDGFWAVLLRKPL